MYAYIHELSRSNNEELTGLRQMDPRLTGSRCRSRHIRLERRFADVDVVDVVLGACGTELAAMTAAMHAADARRDDDDGGGGNHEEDRQNGPHHVH